MRALFLMLLLAVPASANAADFVDFVQGDGHLTIRVGNWKVATYVYDNKDVLRPYFCQVRTPGPGLIKVTRPHPPDPAVNKRNDDHETMHPGLWLAFGDVNGVDFWRNKGRVRHAGFKDEWVQGTGLGRFTVVNRYEKLDGSPVCQEVCRYSIYPAPNGYIIEAKSSFSSDGVLQFGDQEEMGFGARINTPLTVEFGAGEIRNSEGGLNEEGTWGKQAQWCAAGGVVEGRRVGLMLMPDPQNFRPSWFHSRDYGLIVANPFGKKAMTAPDDDAVAPEQTTCASLGFGVYVFDVPQDQQPDYNQVYEMYKTAAGSHVD